MHSVNRMPVITPPAMPALAAVATCCTNSDWVILSSTHNRKFSKIENINSITAEAIANAPPVRRLNKIGAHKGEIFCLTNWNQHQFTASVGSFSQAFPNKEYREQL